MFSVKFVNFCQANLSTKFKSYTVNSQKIVRLSFPSLVFLTRLSFEVFAKLNRLGKHFIPQMKALVIKV